MKFELPENSKMLSPEFTFGVATAAFQIEGANTADGRCESIWDRFCATPGKVLNGDDGTVACDHYNRLEQDLDLIKELGFDAYRFSIAWPRIEPKSGQWNEAGFEFYQRLIDGLIERGIKPYATLYHWDLPQYLQDKGGWVNRETAYAFASYANKVTARFGDKVVSYATFNEPWCSAFMGHRFGEHAPGYKDDRLTFQAAHHLMLAHGLALPAMRKNAPGAQHGIVLNFIFAYANTDAIGDLRAAQFCDEENNHLFLEPLLNGRYPELVFDKHPDWKPTMMPEDLSIINAPIDFIGVNYYSRSVVRESTSKDYENVPQDAPKTDIGWEIYPKAFTDLLVTYSKRYANMPAIFITENGAADNTPCENGLVNDSMRTNYYADHLVALNNAIEAGVNVKGYFAWSLMDNFEWAFGYAQRFGIVHVNYETLERTIKQSGLEWQRFLMGR
ncbi:GH1 family beta-glucosidase [Reinekea marinisedimentorum]|uniref:Beta-glucosidase n=1 Tax=Reinekea marinisedimentorum TaxID=230495 RepID=A0A4R3IG07_9GAMM|nr:GH1 family beta-glucosidase [Reinekea marinisedimentorum]TCS43932.1 beta-glucosidase [Reinekea marinisedimentorum]